MLIKKIFTPIIVMMLLLIVGWQLWLTLKTDEITGDFVSGNGRIEATEIDIATKYSGRVVEIFVGEGDFVTTGQVVAQMQIDVLNAQIDEARAHLQQAINAVASAEAQVAVRESDVAAAQAVVVQRESELDNTRRRMKRVLNLTQKGAASIQQLDDDKAAVRSAEATLTAAKAQVKAAQAAVIAAKSEVNGANSMVTAANATIDRINADIVDSELKAPRDGRVQYRIAEPGEVIGGGRKVLNMVDLSDVYMTFFLPETIVGKVALGNDVHIVLDALPNYVIPAKVSYVASVAQFTPKTVETAVERQKLMFRVKARIDPALLKKHIKQVKTGLPGVATLKLNSEVEWPQKMMLKIPE
ncbi:MAG: HlyD family efflux transporter periplasmic adaptor subunit [Gammaproteobacteria bacterium]|nr:HlyD family efflux transporter periplasmic adaptor subunit [Gammaproteobacteria bacterium]